VRSILPSSEAIPSNANWEEIGGHGDVPGWLIRVRRH
jgi:hypothetical protein